MDEVHLRVVVLDPVPASPPIWAALNTRPVVDPMDPGLPALIEKHVPVPPILAEPKDDAEKPVELELNEFGKDTIRKINLGAYVAAFVNQNERPGSALPDILNDLAYDPKFQEVLKAAR